MQSTFDIGSVKCQSTCRLHLHNVSQYELKLIMSSYLVCRSIHLSLSEELNLFMTVTVLGIIPLGPYGGGEKVSSFMGNSMISYVTFYGTSYSIQLYGCHFKMHHYFHLILVVSSVNPPVDYTYIMYITI